MIRCIFHGYITMEAVHEVSQFFDGSLEEKEFYFSSEGGDTVASGILTNMIKSNPNIPIFLTDVASSCAFNILLDVDNDITLMESFTLSLIHLTDIDVSIRDLMSPINNMAKETKNRVEFLNKKCIYRYGDFLTDSEMKILKNGQNVVLSHKRVKEILTKK